MLISNEKCRDQTWCSVTLEVILLQAAKRTRRHLNDDPKKAPRKTKQEILPSFTDFSLVDLWRIDCTLGQTQLFIDKGSFNDSWTRFCPFSTNTYLCSTNVDLLSILKILLFWVFVPRTWKPPQPTEVGQYKNNSCSLKPKTEVSLKLKTVQKFNFFEFEW